MAQQVVNAANGGRVVINAVSGNGFVETTVTVTDQLGVSVNTVMRSTAAMRVVVAQDNETVGAQAGDAADIFVGNSNSVLLGGSGQNLFIALGAGTTMFGGGQTRRS